MTNLSKEIGRCGCALCAALAIAACGDKNATTEAKPAGDNQAVSATASFDPTAFVPEEEFARLEDFPPEERGAKLLKLYYRWGSTPDAGAEAVAHAEEHGSELAGGALREAFGGWLAMDRDGAQFWVVTKPEGRRQAKLAGALAESLPNAAARAEWANEFYGSDTGRNLMSRVIAEWARESPKAGLSWLESEEDEREDLAGEVGQLVRAWVDRDSHGASVSIAEMGSGLVRDAAITAMVTVIASDNPAAARHWAETIEDSKAREQTLQLLQRISGASGDLSPVAGAQTPDDPSAP